MAKTNRISVASGEAAVVSPDGGTIFLPAGDSTLRVGATDLAGKALTGRDIYIQFQHADGRLAKESTAPRVLPASGEGREESHATRPLDGTGFTGFRLRLPARLEQDIFLFIKLQHEPVEERGTNLLVMQLKIGINPADDRVNRLVVVSGTPQSVTLADGQQFSPLVVRALDDAGNPVAQAGVSFTLSEMRQPTGTRINRPAVVTTGADGVAGVTLTRGTIPGVLVVNAACNGLTASFNLAALPAWENLNVVQVKTGVWDSKEAVTSHVLKARVVTQGNAGEYWPWVGCQLTAITPSAGVEALPASPPLPQQMTSDEGGYLSLVNAKFTAPRRISSGAVTCVINFTQSSAKEDTVNFRLSVSH